jgi:class 3 adenylate cyclase/tetratricopeptide (TPR) repeat protein
MECPRCNCVNAAEARFCDECGHKLDRNCSECGEPNRIGARFCQSCGTPMTLAVFAESLLATAPYRALAWSSGPASEGERKQVTILFADTKGSMEMIAERDPEEARRICDPVLQAMMDGVYQYEGIVNQIMGDGIMALFGAPMAYEDHAIRACHAALSIRRGVERLAGQMRAQFGISPEIRLGLNSGEVVVRTFQNKLQMEYSAVGRTAHLAARLEQIAKPGAIVISGSTLRATSSLVDVAPLGLVPIKGLTQPVLAFELIGARYLKAPDQTVTAPQSPFFGRANELRTLQNISMRAREGHGQVVSLVGEPGIGKSRLASEFRRSIESLGWVQLRTEAISYETNTAYFAVTALLRTYFDIRITDSPTEIREKVIKRIEILNPTLRDTIPSLLFLLDISVDDPEWNAIDATSRRRLTVDSLQRVLQTESRNQPLFIFFENLQWIDGESQTVLDAIVGMIPVTSILMLVTYRSGYEHCWYGKSFYTEVPVGSLFPTAVDQILTGLLGSEPALTLLKKKFWERTEGNPFFLEESVKSLIETGALIGVAGQYTLGVSSDKFEIPETVHAVLAARIDRVPPEDKTLLQTAAVIGKDFSLLILERMTGQEQSSLTAAMRRLQQAELICERGIDPSEFTFRHALTHDVAYASLLREQRKSFHAAALVAMEVAYSERIAENVEALARHALLGEDWDKALRYLRYAASSSATRSEFIAAARCLRSAIDVLSNLPDNNDYARLAIDVRFELHTAIVASGGHAHVFEILEQAENLGRALSDDVRLARILGYQAMGRWWTANYIDAIETGSRALDAARRIKNSRMAAIALVAMGWSHHSRGDWVLAGNAMNEVLDIARGNPTEFGVVQGLPLPQVLAHSWLARGHAERGEFGRALAHAGEAVCLSEAADHPWSRAAASHGLGATLILADRLSDAIDALGKGRNICERYEIASWWAAIASLHGYAFARNGDPEGLPLLEEVAKQTTLMGRLAEKSLRIVWLAEAVLRLQGEVGRATHLGREALELARTHGERPAEAQALFLLGCIASQRQSQETDSAITLYNQALDIAHTLSMNPLQRKCEIAISGIV